MADDASHDMGLLARQLEGIMADEGNKSAYANIEVNFYRTELVNLIAFIRRNIS